MCEVSVAILGQATDQAEEGGGLMADREQLLKYALVVARRLAKDVNPPTKLLKEELEKLSDDELKELLFENM